MDSEEEGRGLQRVTIIMLTSVALTGADFGEDKLLLEVQFPCSLLLGLETLSFIGQQNKVQLISGIATLLLVRDLFHIADSNHKTGLPRLEKNAQI